MAADAVVIVEIKLLDCSQAPCGCKGATLVMEGASEQLCPVYCSSCGAGWLEKMPIKQQWFDARGLS